jgi:predicted Ser/Thr protein kinase
MSNIGSTGASVLNLSRGASKVILSIVERLHQLSTHLIIHEDFLTITKHLILLQLISMSI